MVQALPWLISYTEDPHSAGRYPEGSERVVLRPILEVSLVGSFPMDEKVIALVDSGSEHTLAAPGVARAIGLDVESAFWRMPLGLGGEPFLAKFLDVTVRLHHPDDPFDQFIEWETEIGFLNRQPKASWSVLLGQVGFLDRFTVTMHRHAQALAIEPLDRFDERFGRIYKLAEYESIRRFKV